MIKLTLAQGELITALTFPSRCLPSNWKGVRRTIKSFPSFFQRKDSIVRIRSMGVLYSNNFFARENSLLLNSLQHTVCMTKLKRSRTSATCCIKPPTILKDSVMSFPTSISYWAIKGSLIVDKNLVDANLVGALWISGLKPH